MHGSIQVSSVSSQIFRMAQKPLGMGTLGVEIKNFFGGTWLLNSLEAFDFSTFCKSVIIISKSVPVHRNM